MTAVAILGGHGKVALRLAQLLSERGDSVTSVFRNPGHESEVAATGARTVVLDLEQADARQMADVLQGHDAVIWSAGAGGGDPARTYAVDRDAAIRSMEAAATAGVDRYVMVSYKGAGPDHGVPEDHPFHPYAEAKAAADEHLRDSGLDWTIVAPGGLTDDPGVGRIQVGDPADRDDVPRDDVAAVVAAVLEEPATSRRMIEFVAGELPIPEALRSG